MSRLLIVSNRLPISVERRGEELVIERSMGGLATGLAGPHEQSGGVWIGWPGYSELLSEAHHGEATRRFAELRVVPVPLSADEVARYYEGFSNGILWPLFHYFLGRLPLNLVDFEVYKAVNERFAEVVALQYQEGDQIWVHDYQLMLVPQLLRDRLPDARIGYFHHIPFPSSELFRVLPQREALLSGLLGADLIGFHTANYMRHFANTVMLVLGASPEVDRVRWHERLVQLGAFPMGIDAQKYDALGRSESVQATVRELTSTHERLLLGVDRLDYTKGIPRRLMAYERMLEQHPELLGKVRMIQIAVLSRTGVEAYQELSTQVETQIGRIHGRFATPTWAPVHYMTRGFSDEELSGLFRAATAMLVTPTRDGMNLVAKEFVASRVDERGVLVLSEFAGAASELAEAYSVNPYDIIGMADAFYKAITMPEHEQQLRMRPLRSRVARYDVRRWASSFLETLSKAGTSEEVQRTRPSPRWIIDEAVQRVRAAPELALMIDYDGTLVNFAKTPGLAAPDNELLDILTAFAQRPGTSMHVVSGRNKETLDSWLGQLPIGLHAEHGLWSRWAIGQEWEMAPLSDHPWRTQVLPLLESLTERTPGSLVEEKTASVAWHYRMTEPTFGEARANELKLLLSSLLSNAPVEILPGDKVIEVRPHGINKGRIVPLVQARVPNALLLAIGDDRTDEDLFAALPENAETFHVGPNPSRARFRLRAVNDARSLLRALLGP